MKELLCILLIILSLPTNSNNLFEAPVNSDEYIITTVAGNHSLCDGYSGDGGPAIAAQLGSAEGVTIDHSGNLYIADYHNHNIRKVNSSGIITTCMSHYYTVSNKNGKTDKLELNLPISVAVDIYGSLYVVDGNNEIVLKKDTLGAINIVAGTYKHGMAYSGDGGQATVAVFCIVSGVAIGANGNLYIADNCNEVVRMVDNKGIISTIAGNGKQGYTGDGGLATNAELYMVHSVALDASGNLYICDNYNNVIRKVSSSGIITTIAGNGFNARSGLGGFSGDGGPATNAELARPEGIAVDSVGNLYIADCYNNVIRCVNTSGIITTVAGNYGLGYGFSGDGGPATKSQLSRPNAVAIDAHGNLYIADSGNNVIRKVSMKHKSKVH